MSDAVQSSDEYYVKLRIPPERLAWGTLLIAFSTFCILCVSTTVGLHYFFFQSAIPIDVVLQASRGTVSVRETGALEEAVTGTRQISSMTSMRTDRTDSLSQANLVLHDSSDGELIIFITLKGSTQIKLNKALRPRFGWSSRIFEIEFVDFVGEADIRIEDNLSRTIDLWVRTPQGVEIRFEQSGHYEIVASDTRVQLINHDGVALLIAPDRLTTSSIPQGNAGIIDLINNTIMRQEAPQNLVVNSQLETQTSDGSGFSVLPPGWSCKFEPPNNLPRGNILFDSTPDGRQALRMVRSDNAASRGDTWCEQSLGNDDMGFDIRDYSNVFLRVSTFIDFHSVSGCGEQASECPLMLRIDFIDQNGKVQSWYHGIYANLDPGFSGYKRICDSCLGREHVRIFEKSWYTYESGNLFEILPGNLRPQAIRDVIFYASGHQYNVYVGEVSLIAQTSSTTLNGQSSGN